MIAVCVALKTTTNSVGFGVIAAVVTKWSFFWVITPCRPLKVHRRFREASNYFIEVEDYACYLFHAGSFLAYF
jgi:hypothetical protein